MNVYMSLSLSRYVYIHYACLYSYMHVCMEEEVCRHSKSPWNIFNLDDVRPLKLIYKCTKCFESLMFFVENVQRAETQLHTLTSKGSTRTKSCPCRSAGDEGRVEPRRRTDYSLRAWLPWLPHNRRRDRGLREGEWGIERQQRSGGWRMKVVVEKGWGGGVEGGGLGL